MRNTDNKRRDAFEGQSRNKKPSRLRRAKQFAGIVLAVILLLIVVPAVHMRCSEGTEKSRLDRGNIRISSAERPALDVQLLSVNEYSRPGIQVDHIDGIVIHYTANPGASAQDNRDYFENLARNHTTKASSNFIVGLEGEIIQCIPTWEIAYASNDRNGDTVSIECCHPDETGFFNDATYRSLVHLTAWLCNKYGLTADSVIRHYDVTGKICPKYFVEHEEAWQDFRDDVAYAIAH